MLTGEKIVLAADILFDCGHSLNPAVDIGQARACRLGQTASETSSQSLSNHRVLHVSMCSHAQSMQHMPHRSCKGPGKTSDATGLGLNAKHQP